MTLERSYLVETPEEHSTAAVGYCVTIKGSLMLLYEASSFLSPISMS
jgi:hypothetical protein